MWAVACQGVTIEKILTSEAKGTHGRVNLGLVVIRGSIIYMLKLMERSRGGLSEPLYNL